MGRETFTTRVGMLLSMIGVAVGLGNLWRFPYMVGRFGGTAFVLFYLFFIALIGVPALMAEWILGRRTRRGPVGAYAAAGIPFGTAVGWVIFAAVTAAVAYYSAVIGWTVLFGAAQVSQLLGGGFDPSVVLPPASGFAPRSYLVGAGMTALVILAACLVLVRGLREGIERASSVLTPMLLVALFLVIGRSLTLPGAGAGVEWFILKFEVSALTPQVMVAALGQSVFSLALGGTYMVVYGSYLGADEELGSNALWTAGGDTAVGLLAGFAIFPAVFALGLDPSSGPDLLFVTLPEVFSRVPAGKVFGAMFFVGLAGVAFLSALAAFEVLVAGLTDNTGIGRKTAVWTMGAAGFLLSLPPTANLEVFVPWDLTFGSGLQTTGVLLAVATVGWAFRRSELLAELRTGDGTDGGPGPPPPGKGKETLARVLYYWLRYVVPAAVLIVGGWWVASEVLGMAGG